MDIISEQETSITEEPQQAPAGGKSELMICQGAKCTCDKAVDPAPKELKVLSHQKYVINEGSDSKLVATTLENALPNLNFGQCKVPNPNNPVPCSAKLEWKDYYDHVELPQGAYALTEKSTAICTAKGGNIKIVQTGQQAEITAKELENSQAASWPADSPLLNAADIEILQADNEEDTPGAKVKRIGITEGGNVQPVGKVINFKVLSYYKDPTEAEKKGINWVLYDAAGKPVMNRNDAGEEISAGFKNPGVYMVEAYGKTAGDKASTQIITIKNNEVGAVMTADGKSVIRVNEEATFYAKGIFPDLPLPGLEKTIWSIEKLEGKGNPVIVMQTGGMAKVICTDEARFVLVANINGVPKQSAAITAVINSISSVSADRTNVRTNEAVNFKVGSYKVEPANEIEKSLINWTAKDEHGKVVAAFTAKKGESIQHKFEEEGEYTVQPFMRHPSGQVQVKVKVEQPALVKAQWEYPEGGYKDKTGLNEKNRPHLVFSGCEALTVDLEYGVIDKEGKAVHFKTIKDIKIPASQELYKPEFDFTPETDKNAALFKDGSSFYFKVVSKTAGYKILNTDVLQPQKKLKLVTSEDIFSIQFYKAGKKVDAASYGDSLTCIIRTRNITAKELTVKVMRKEARFGNDALRLDTAVYDKLLKIESDGTIKFTFTLDKSWEKSYDEKLHNFYIAIKENEFFGKNWNLVAFKKGVPANGGKATAQVEAVDNPQTKNGICPCEARVRAFIRMIRVGEGTIDEGGYERLFGGKSFIKDFNRDWSTHPNIQRPFGKTTSSAAGAYQILIKTYRGLSTYAKLYKIADFSPESQDMLCVVLLKHVRVGTLDMIIKNQIQKAIEKCSYEWASLPPGRYGQPVETMEQALASYHKYYNEELAGTTSLHLKKGFLKQFGNNCCQAIKPDEAVNCACKKKHIDLRGDNSKWQTQFDSRFGDRTEQNSACWRACKVILENYGVTGGNLTGNGPLYQIAVEKNNGLVIDKAKATSSIAYLDKQLEAGKPILVGVDHSYNYRGGINTDKSTDHFVVIVGRACENNKIYYLFYEVGTSREAAGTSNLNRLYVQPDNTLTGSTAYSTTKKYTVLQVRENK